MSGCTIWPTFCSSVILAMIEAMRASIPASLTTALDTRGQGTLDAAGPSTACRVDDSANARSRDARTRAQDEVLMDDSLKRSGKGAARAKAIREWGDAPRPRRKSTLETHAHPYSIRARRIEHELLNTTVDGSLRAMRFVSHVVDEPLDAHIAVAVRVADAEIEMHVAVDFVVQAQQLDAVAGRDAAVRNRCRGGHFAR